MNDRIAELRALRQRWLDAPPDTSKRYTAMRLYEISLMSAGPDLLNCAEYLQKLIDQEHRTVPSHVRQELIRDALGSLARLNGKTT